MLCEYSLHIRYKYTKSSIYIIYLYTHATHAVWVEDLTLWANLLPSVLTFIADWGFYTSYIIFSFNCQVSVNIGHAPRSASSEYLSHATLSYQGKRCPNYSRNVSQAQSSSTKQSMAAIGNRELWIAYEIIAAELRSTADFAHLIHASDRSSSSTALVADFFIII